jgi:hypothetical protein
MLVERFRRSEFLKVSAILILLIGIFFVRSIFLGEIPSSADILKYWALFRFDSIPVQNNILSDVANAYEPWLWFNHFSFQHLQIPLWNPYSAGGVPHLANIQTTLFQVITWPILVLGMSKATLLFYYSAKLFLIGISTYYYLKSIKLDFCPSLAGSIAFTFMNFNVVWLYYSPSSVIFVLPLSFYLIEKIMGSQNQDRYFLALAVVYALGVFAGHPETFFHIVVISLVYFVFRLLLKRATLQESDKMAGKYALVCLLGAGLSAVQLLPFLEYLMNSNAWVVRENIRYMQDWHTAVLNFVPEFYGSPSIYINLPFFVHFTNYNESAAGYAGVTILCLAVFALIAKYKDALLKFYLVVGVWAAGVVYGVPLIFDITTSLPLFTHAANHRLLFLLGFVAIVLGSMGFDQILKSSEEGNGKRILKKFYVSTSIVLVMMLSLVFANQEFLWAHITSITPNFDHNIFLSQGKLVAIAVFLILVTLLGVFIIAADCSKPQMRKLAIIGLIALIFAETGVHGMLLEPAIDEKYFYPKIAAFDFINQKDELYRSVSLEPDPKYPNPSSVYPVNTQMIYGIYDIRNYDALEVNYYWKLLNTFSQGMMMLWIDLSNVDERFLDFMGAKWVFSRSDLSSGNYSRSYALVKNYGDYFLFENTDAMPRAFVIQNATFSSNDSEILEMLKNPSFDWRSSVILSGDDRRIERYFTKAQSTIEIVDYQPNRIKIDAVSNAPGFLVISDTYYPGWNAYINGSKVDILRANYAFRAINLDVGKSIVEFKYEPLSLYVGAIISCTAIFIIIFLYIKIRRKPGTNGL